jgi:acetylornithine deacetylase/succinyl-diaminopimelate desuccinylase-like protein
LSCAGRQGHSSLSDELGWPNTGVEAARAVVAVADRLRLHEPVNDEALAGWRATVNTGLAYRGGVGYGVLPGRMDVDTEVRLLPGMRREDVHRSFSDSLEAADVAATVLFDTPPNDWLPPTAVDRDHPLARAAREALGRVLGRLPADSVFPGTTDATWFASLAGVPTLPALGPGLLCRAHGADEWVSIAALTRAADLYEEIGRAFCPAQPVQREAGELV